MFINVWLGIVIFQLALFMFYISTSQKIYPRIGSTGVRTESIEWLIEGRAFLPSYDLAPPSPPPPFPPSLCRRTSLLTVERGCGRSQIMRRRESLYYVRVLHILFPAFSEISANWEDTNWHIPPSYSGLSICIQARPGTNHGQSVKTSLTN